MKKFKKLPVLFAVMFCMAAFLFPTSAFAASDKEPPTLTATLEGDTLHIEASDNSSGVEAVYIDSTRVNSLVNGKADVLLKDYAGNNKQVSIYAVDGAGNRSETVAIDNPYYQAPAPLPTPTAPASSTPAPAPSTPAPAISAPSTSTSAPASSAANSGTEESDSSETESAITEGDNVFTPEGTGTVVDIATDEDGKLFYTIATPAGNVFYLVIDLARTDGNNVYFLNAVTEDDLMALAETDGSTTGGVSAIPTPEPEPTPDPTPDPEPEPEPEPKKESGGMGTIILILLAVAAVGGAGWYFKIYKPKQDAFLPDDFEESEDDEDDEIEFESEEYAPADYDEQEADEYQSGDGSDIDEE